MRLCQSGPAYPRTPFCKFLFLHLKNQQTLVTGQENNEEVSDRPEHISCLSALELSVKSLGDEGHLDSSAPAVRALKTQDDRDKTVGSLVIMSSTFEGPGNRPRVSSRFL